MYGMTTNLFSSLRTDPGKTADGVWFTHPESGDRLRIRPLMCGKQVKAYIESLEDYVAQHGEDTRESDEAEKHAEIMSIAIGQVVDWELSSDAEAKYDQAQMASALADPELDELRLWIRTCGLNKDRFRPEVVAGK